MDYNSYVLFDEQERRRKNVFMYLLFGLLLINSVVHLWEKHKSASFCGQHISLTFHPQNLFVGNVKHNIEQIDQIENTSCPKELGQVYKCRYFPGSKGLLISRGRHLTSLNLIAEWQ